MSIPDDLQALLDEVIVKYQAILDEREPAMRRLPALLGETSTDDTATVENMPRYCYARVGSDQDVVKLLNVRTPHTVDLAVLVGYDPGEPDLFQVLSERGGLYAGENDNPLATIKHAIQHEWGNPAGFDPPFLQPRQLRGCRPSATNPNSLFINLDGGIYEIGGVLIEWKGSAIEGALDLTTHVPLTGWRWVLITMNSAGPAVTAGTSKTIVDLTDIPASTDPTDWRVCAVLLKAGDTAITDWPQEQRIVDLRFAGSRSVSGSGGYVDFGNCIVVAKSGGNVDNIPDGLLLATNETHVVVLNGDWANNVVTPGHFLTVSGLYDQHYTGPFGVRLVGSDDVGPIVTLDDNALWSCMVINRGLSGGSGDFIGLDGSDVLAYKHLSDLQVALDGGATGRNVYGAKFGAPVGHASTLSRCIFKVENAGSGTAVECVGGDVTFDNMCELHNDDTGGLALIISGNGIYQFEHARIEGAVLVTGAATVHFRNCRIAGDVTANGGAATIYARDSWIGGNISLAFGDILIPWNTNLDSGSVISGGGAVVPLGLVKDNGSFTDHYVGPVTRNQATYMRLVPDGLVTGVNRASYFAYWMNYLQSPVNFEGLELAAFDDGSELFGVLRTIAGGVSTLRDLRLGVGVDKTKYTKFDADGNVTVPNSIIFNTSPSPAASSAGSVYWNGQEYTLDIVTGLGPVLQAGQEIHVIAYNDTGAQLDNGTAVYPIAVFNEVVSIAKAQADSHETISVDVAVCTMDIPNGQYGLVTWFGKVRFLNTLGFVEGDNLWLSAMVAGEWVNVQPEFPNYTLQIGGMMAVHATEGVIFVDVKGRPFDIAQNFWNGIIQEPLRLEVDSDGVNVTCSLSPAGSHPNLTMVFSDGRHTLDTSSPIVTALTPGTSGLPQVNYVYISKLTKTVAVSTVDWPYSVEHIKLTRIVLDTAARTQLDGALGNRNYNDGYQTDTGQGRFTAVTQNIRKGPCKYDTGVEASIVIDTIPTPDAVWLKTTAGAAYQLNRQLFPMLDMTQYGIDAVNTGLGTFTISDDGDLSTTFPDGRRIAVHNSTGNDGRYTIASTLYSAPDFTITVDETVPDATADGTIGDNLKVVNDPVTPYKTALSISELTTDATGASTTNSSFKIVFSGIQNLTGTAQHYLAHLPTGTYARTKPEDAEADLSNYAVYDAPLLFEGTIFLICEATFSRTPGGDDWTLYQLTPLLGKFPNNAVGGGIAGGGPTTFLGLTDTENTYVGKALQLQQVAAAETGLESTNTITLANEGLRLLDTGADHYLTIKPSEDLAASRFLNLVVGAGDRTITLQGNPTLDDWFDQSVKVAASVNFAQVSLPDAGKLILGTGGDGELYSSSDDIYLVNVTQDKDIYVQINDGGIIKTSLFVQGSTNNLGFGTTNPQFEFHIVTEDSNTNFAISCFSDTASLSGIIDLEKSRGSEVSPTALLSGNRMGRLTFSGYNGSTTPVGAELRGEAAVNFSGSDYSTRLKIRTRSGTTMSDQIMIDHDGGVFMYNLKSGATQGGAGAAAGEMWTTSSHATLPDNVIMIGV